ncbi:MAG: 6-phosphofructokinase [Oscillospiraceae bacterium]|nr:6-phosphofructokinase [Oscillospiraceae bacterium]
MNIAVAQSGGPTCAINSSLAGIVKEAKRNGVTKIYGAKNGIDGVINNRFCNLGELLKTDDELRLLRATPSTALGSCRIKLQPAQYETIFANLQKYKIEAFFYIGGNDSMDTVDKLHDYAAQIGSNIKFVGVPKTIDNDLPETDHTPGFGSAVKYLATTIKEIICDSNVYNLNSVTVIEIMGRDAGWLAASSALLKESCNGAPHLIYLPEKPFCTKSFLDDIKRLHQKTRAVIVAVSEGLKNEDGGYIAAANQSGKSDVFGHKYLAGLGKLLEHEISDNLGCKVRSVELNVCQRCAAHTASETDLNEAEEIAAAAVQTALKGKSGVMMTIRRVSNIPYKVEYIPVCVKLCANRERLFPLDWISSEGNDILAEVNDYFLPLIQGEVKIKYDNGIPVHFRINDDLFRGDF